MKIIRSYEAKRHLPQLLKRVRAGEGFVITRHGAPIAKLVPVDAEQPRDIAGAIKGLLRFRSGHKAAPGEIRRWIEGRRA